MARQQFTIGFLITLSSNLPKSQFWESSLCSHRPHHSSWSTHWFSLPACLHHWGVVLRGTYHGVLRHIRVLRLVCLISAWRHTLQAHTMLEFEIALGLWTVDEQTSVIYTTVICDFTVDISVYWMHSSEMVLLSSSSRRKAPNFFQYSYIFMSFSPTPSPVGPTIIWW